jgi:carbamoyltransferase
MSDAILGLSAYYHDSAAVLLCDGEIVAAAHEERFTRKKQDASFPACAAAYVLDESGLRLDDLAAVAFYEKPLLKFERLLETYHSFAPAGLVSFLTAIPVWIKKKLFMKRLLRKELANLDRGQPPQLLFPEHHLSHAASAFFPSPYEEAAILTVDGVGEWATTTIGRGEGREITIQGQINFPHSLGLLYSAFTCFCGFQANSGEYKLMGLASYGDPHSEQVVRWRKAILEEMIDLRPDGSFLLNMDYFNYATGLTMYREELWQRLFSINPRQPECEPTRPYMDLALAVQQVTEEVVGRLAATARDLTGCSDLVMAGGVALNCVANGKLVRRGPFERIWIQPAAGDAGGALGAALAAYHIWAGRPRRVDSGGNDAMQGSFLGPQFGPEEVERLVRRTGAVAEHLSDFDRLCDQVAALLDEGRVVGWFQGRMEWGPRALGNRSILADPRNPEMQRRVNLKIKYREGFRPFAPSVLAEAADEIFELNVPSPYMLLVAEVRYELRKPLPEGYTEMDLLQRLYYPRSIIPAVTHVDYSARIQTVHQETNPRYWQLIDAFRRRTGCALLLNTSFNVRDEPIVCTVDDAYRCFMRTEMDFLVVGNHLFDKNAQ